MRRSWRCRCPTPQEKRAIACPWTRRS